MKSIKFAILALSLLILSASGAYAQSSSGNWQFTYTDSLLKTADFDAATQLDGSTTGSLRLSDEQPIYYQDVDGTREAGTTDKYNGFTISASFDGLIVMNTNEAVMSGTIRDATIPSLIGMRVLLAVKDNGDNTKVFDKLRWSVSKFVERTWTPSDAELKTDPGVGLTWVATDYERKDDRGVQMPVKSQPADTSTYPVAAFELTNTSDDPPRAAGDIVVKP